MREADNTRQLADYILGNLPQAEEARLEAEYLADPQLQDQLLCVEGELVDAYAQGRLSRDDRVRLEARFFASPRGRRKLEFVNSLTHLAREDASREQLTQTPMAKPASARGFPFVGMLALAAALLLVLALGWSLRERLSHRSEQAQQIPPGTESPSPERSGEQPVLVSIFLQPASRNMDRIQRANIPATAQKVNIQVNIGPVLHDTYRVVLVNARDRVQWRGSGLKPRSIPSGNVIDLNLPASAFEPGEYTLMLSPNANGARPIAEYVFVVEKR